MMNELVIATLCAGVSGPGDACLKAAEAASRQSGFYESVNQVEDKTKTIAESEVRQVAGETTVTVVSYGAMIAKIGSGGAGAVNMKGGPFCDKITLTGSKKQGSVGLGWSF